MAKKTKIKLELSRRDFLTVAAAAAGSVVAAQALTVGPLSPFSVLKQTQIQGEDGQSHGNSKYRWGMIINLDRCIGCEYCLRACSAPGAPPTRCPPIDPGISSLPSKTPQGFLSSSAALAYIARRLPVLKSA